MQFVYLIGGGAPLIRDFAISATLIQGTPVEASVGTEDGVAAWSNANTGGPMVGLTMSAATYTTTQATDGSDAQARVPLLINPNAAFRARMSGGAIVGTDLVLYTVDVANSAGTSVDTDTASGGAKEEGVMWGYSGTNVGQYRNIKADDDAGIFTCDVPFLGTLVGDVFLVAGTFLGSDNADIQLTSDFTEFDAETDAPAGATNSFLSVGWELNDIGGEGRSNSWVHILSDTHRFAQSFSAT